MSQSDHIIIEGHRHIPYQRVNYEAHEQKEISAAFYEHLDARRSVRDFSSRPVSRKVIEDLIMTASTAPSGAHKQPWTFCAVSSADIKSKIRTAAEKEERESYESRMSERWLKDLKPMGTNAIKPFLEIAPWLIIVFKRVYEIDPDGKKHNNYYVNESVGIACGMLITAIHNAGLVTLTHTPSPMNFLTKVLDRPSNERAFLLLPVGYPADTAYVPDIKRKTLNDVAVFYD